MHLHGLRRLVFPALALVLLASAPGAPAAEIPASTLDELKAAKAGGTQTLRLEGLELENGEKVTLELARLEVFSRSFRLSINGVDQPEGAGLPDTAYFAGRVLGENGSLAMIAVGQTTRGLVQTSTGAYLLAPEKDAYRARDGGRLHAIRADAAASRGSGYLCATDEMPLQGFRPGRQVPASPAAPRHAAPSWSGIRNVDVAIETDYELYSAFGSTAGLLNYIGDMAAAASAIYLRDIQTTLQIPYVSVWTNSSDPWAAATSIDGLAELGDYWHANRTGVSRTTVHQLSKRSTGGGVAWVGVLCAEDFQALINGSPHWGGGYGFSGSLDGQFSTIDPSFYWDILEFSHELGHNFDSPHTHCYDPVIDQCYNGQAGCYSGPTSVPPGGGTIMSYCHLRPGGTSNINLIFGAPGQPSDAVRQTMRDHVENVSCTCTNPLAPAGTEPLNGATGVTTGTLRWTYPGNSGSWTSSGVTAYEVYLDTVNPPEKRISTTRIDPYMAMPTWFPLTTYYWKVVARNGCGTASSPVYSFTTGSACSFSGAAPALISPASGATGQGRKLILSWGAVAGAAHYTVYLGTVNPPSGALRVVYAPRTSIEVMVAPGTTYHWRVKATPGCGNGAAVFSSTRSFATAGTSPVLSSVSPVTLNRWAGSATLSGSGSGLSTNTLLFLDMAGRRAGSFSLGTASSSSVSGAFSLDATAPAGLYDAGLTNYGVEHQRLPMAVMVRAFTDVPDADYYVASSSRVVDAGIMEADFDSITAGPQFSPGTTVTRDYMAEYLAKGYQWWRTGSTAVPAATCVPSGAGSTDFPDVPCSHPRWLYIHWIKTWGVTVGSPCAQGICFLPNSPVDRAQMVTFLLRLKYGATLPTLLSSFGTKDPGCSVAWPGCVGWTDAGLQVPVTTWPHAEANVAYADRLTAGCAAGPPLTFCVFDPVPRGQMVEFLGRIVNLVPNP